nr:N-acyl homoserine lactonase family protein [Microcella alkalica]
MLNLTNPGTKIRIAVRQFLVQTSRGFVLIDTGNDPLIAQGQKMAEERWGALATAARPIMGKHQVISEQLKLVGLSTDDIKMVVYTHLHHDHCGAATYFPKALHIVQKAEYRFAMNLDSFAAFPYVRHEYDDPTINWRFAQGDWTILPGFQLISTPGHTPGHQSIALWDVPDVGSLIITGDAVNCRENISADVLGGIIYDAKQAADSVHRIVALAQATGASVMVSHDKPFYDTVPHAPEPLRPFTADEQAFCQHGINTLYSDVDDPNNLI